MNTESRVDQYVVALGSNRRHHKYGSPRNVIKEALNVLDQHCIKVLASSSVITTAPIGPSTRSYANAAALVETSLSPEQMLHRLKKVEALFGSRKGQRWSTRTLDLDIILWSGGAFHSHRLTIPHSLFRTRHFVLRPLLDVAPNWVDPVTNRSVRHLFTRLTEKQRKEG